LTLPRPPKADGGVKFSNFLFPDCRDPARDGIVIDETLREAMLSDELGFDAIWLAEHHFDGICAYVDPISFGGALAVAVKRATLGFAVIQTSLHHPVRLAEQLALIDNLVKGRLIVGLGRGTAYNIYDYLGFGIDHSEAQARLDEAEEIIVKAWTGGGFAHRGRFWQIEVPLLRPRPFSKPHPPIIRGASSDHSLVEFARAGKPFLMNVQSLENTARRIELYRQGMREAGYDEAAIAKNLAASWVWRNVYVADSDSKAERVAIPYFEAMTRTRGEMRNRIFAETGQRIAVPASDLPEARTSSTHGIVCGSPSTVAEAFSQIEKLGVGGVIGSFRLGPMPHEIAAESLTLFMQQVAPRLR
jgi:alkanesulfonate monooxygenase SsuD/methylene tetrahydromethanopterin reductase-like flavin-dependent oxidoreductase (luciferase family)